MSISLQQEVPAYTIEEYVLRCKVFSKVNSILVEGRTDKGIIARVLGAYHGDDWPLLFSVDTAEILQSPTESPIGNREKVEEVFLIEPNLASMTGLVDREYRGYERDTYTSEQVEEVCVKGNLYWTYGHSIENTFLNTNLVIEAIRNNFPQVSSGELFEQIRESQIKVVRDIAALCLACSELNQPGILSASRGIAFERLWAYDSDGALGLEVPGVRAIFHAKSLDKGRQEQIVSRFAELQTILESHTESDLENLCHGHYGAALYWSAIAFIVLHTRSSDSSELRRIAEFANKDAWWLGGAAALVKDHDNATRRAPYLLRACRVL